MSTFFITTVYTCSIDTYYTYCKTGNANALKAVTLFLEESSEFHIFFGLRINSLLILSLFKGPSYPTSSSLPNYLYISLSPSSFISTSSTTINFPSNFLFPLSMYIYAHLLYPKFMPMSFENAVTISNRSLR